MAPIGRDQSSFKGNKEHLAILLDAIEKDDIRIWNEWRDNNIKELPNLMGADLSHADLSGIDLTGAALDDSILYKTKFITSELNGTNFYRANMVEARLDHARVHGGMLRKADLTNATIWGAVFNSADLKGAKLTGCKIHGIGRTDWNIEGVKCEYVITDLLAKKRLPNERNFEPGEFEKIYKSYPIIDLEFHENFDAFTILVADYASIQLNKEDDKYDFQIKEVSSYGNYPVIKVSVKSKDQIEEGRALLEERIARYQEQLKQRELDISSLHNLMEKAMSEPKNQIIFNGPTTIDRSAIGGNIEQQINNSLPPISEELLQKLNQELESANLPDAEKSFGKKLLDEMKDGVR